MKSTVTLTVNGKTQVIETDPKRTLLDVLREELGLTGTKYGCGEGRCGSCTVLLDGKRVPACQVAVADAGGKALTTIEGLARGDALHPVQEAFLAEGAMQCGYCTPGMILTAVALLEKNSQPSDKEILDWMNGNLCRCNGYPEILRAIRRTAGNA
jgi:aerobic-type carbon monoxide dehydrogenase small subunit (CoxS/CutS family)